MSYQINVENKFEVANRDIHVRRKEWDDVLEELRLSYPQSEVQDTNRAEFALGQMETQGDYLEICVDNEVEELGPCRIMLPANAPFTFVPGTIGSITVEPPKNGSAVTAVKIPSGLPTWKLEIMQPSPQEVAHLPEVEQMISREGDDPDDMNNVTVGEDQPGGGG